MMMVVVVVVFVFVFNDDDDQSHEIPSTELACISIITNKQITDYQLVAFGGSNRFFGQETLSRLMLD